MIQNAFYVELALTFAKIRRSDFRLENSKQGILWIDR